MIIIEASRRGSRRAVARIREAFIEWDRVLFKQVDPRPEDCYLIIREGKGYALAIDDPTVRMFDLEEQLIECE